IDYDIGQLIFIEEYDDYVGPGTEPVENTTQNITQNTSMNYLDDEDIPESEIIMHNSSSDCWIVLDGIVLDITSMLSDYSDLEPLAELCGMDVTNDLDNGTLPMDEELFFEYYDEMFEHELGFVQE
ncbi:hypothetical protein KJ780_00180, partial [Candidatus Micrarchaeota archaeon]|nr:hypothetical protein [Candidatus Micrarchaeota archaeon]